MIKNEETNAENIQFFNQLNLSEVRNEHLNPKGKIYSIRDRAHGVLMLWIEFEGFTQRHV